jgi:hypothetical protein
MERLEGLDKGAAGSTFEMFLRINGCELNRIPGIVFIP